MTDITELAQRTDLLMDNALETAKQLRELSESSVAEAIFESIVENENGKEIQFERPISDLVYAAFLQLERLVEALEKTQETIAFQQGEIKALLSSLESRTVTVKLPPRVDSSNVPFAAHTWNCCLTEVEKRLTGAGIKWEAE